MIKVDKNISKKSLNYIKKSLIDEGKSQNGHRKSLNCLGMDNCGVTEWALNGPIKRNRMETEKSLYGPGKVAE